MLRTTYLCSLAAAIVLLACQKPPASAPASAEQPVVRTQPQPTAPAPVPAAGGAAQTSPQPGAQPAAEPQPAAQPAAQQPPQPAPAPNESSQAMVKWFAGGLKEALAEAKNSNRIVFADFNADWCTWCQKMNREVFATDEAATALEPVICVSIDFENQRDTADRYLVSRELPVVIWFNSDGTVRERIEAFQDKATFLANTSRIKADIGTINHLRRKVDAHPADLDQRYDLYRRLLAVGDKAGAAAQRAEIEKADPQGNSRPLHHFKYDALMEAINAHWAETKALDPKQIEGLRNFLEVEADPEILWDGWMSLANTYQYYGEQAQARGESVGAKDNRSIQRVCLTRAWRGIPQDDDTLHAHVTRYAALFWDLRAELSADDKVLLLSMTEAVAKRFEADALVQDLHARALYLDGQKDAAQAACERAIELANQSGLDTQNFERTLNVIRGGK